MSKIVLFLDFDGVLHPDPCIFENKFCRIHHVEEVIHEFEECVEIVISSAWRDYYPLPDLREMFSPDFGALIVGATPSIRNPSPAWAKVKTPAWEREYEIETWLAENRPNQPPWLAIDDRSEWFRPDTTNLLRTDPRKGFVYEQRQTLRSMLKLRKDEL